MASPARIATRALLALALACAGAPAAADGPCALADATLLAGSGGSGLGGTGHSPGGVGGTGLSPRGGVGGTGNAPEREGGVGGTGHLPAGGVGGTGVFGTVTGFGSLCVNGLRIGYDAGATVLLRGETVGTTRDLAVGQVVWLVAEPRAGRLFTDRIEVVSAVLGVIAALDDARGRLVVGGRVVEVPFGTPIVSSSDAAPLTFQRLEPGDALEVAALPGADGRLVASRVVRHARMPDGRARFAEIRAELASGRAGGRVFERLSIEGYARPGERPGTVALPGIELELPAEAGARPERDRRIIAEGPLRERAVRAERVLVRETPTRPEKPERPGPGALPKPVAPERPDARSGGAATRVRPERAAVGPVERPDRPVKPERIERPERPETPERPELERPEVFERPDRIERAPTQDAIQIFDVR